MLENKLVQKIGKGIGILGMVVGLGLNSCGPAECLKPEYNPNQTTQKSYLINTKEQVSEGTKDKQYNLNESCPDGCSYDSDKGCCWCPD